MKEIFLFSSGISFGVLLVMFIAYLDNKISNGKDVGIDTRKRTKFMSYLLATCWEIQFILAGLLLGYVFFS